MAHGENAERGGRPGYEFWSRRPCSHLGFGRWVKTMTHRAERRQGKDEIAEQVADLTRTPERTPGGGVT